VQDVSLQVGRGEVVGLLGPNGAGKTSVIKMLLGLVRPDAGEVLLLGRPAGDPAARARVGYLPELFRYHPWLSASEVLTLHVRLSGLHVPEPERDECLALVGLAERAGDRVGGFSKGMQQRLGLAVALVARPELVVLDEPTSALDPLGRVDVRDLVLALKERGVAVLLNSHLIGEVERVCDRVVILDRGRVAAEGTLAQLLGRRELRVHLTHVSPAAQARLARTGSVRHEGEWATVALPADDDGTAVPDLVRDLAALGRPGARRRAAADQPGGAPARHPARRRRRPRGRRPARRCGDGRCGVTARTVLTIAALTLREATRRRVLLALAVLTVVLLALSGWGFSRFAAETGGTLTSGEARLTASIVLNLVMFGFSLIAALGTAFLAGPTLAGETESGIALAVLPDRSAGRRTCSASGWGW
jgi:ABC-2 type transport system ATP-binding protein